MWKRLGRILHWATSVDALRALGSAIVSTSVFAWISSQVEWLWAQGWAAITLVAIMGASLAMAGIGLFMLALSRRRGGIVVGQLEPPPIAAKFPQDAQSNNSHSEANNELVAFVADHMVPTIESQIKFQSNLMTAILSDKEYISRLAISGLGSGPEVKEFWESYVLVMGSLYSSPQTPLPFNRLAEAVTNIEKGYSAFFSQGLNIAGSGHVDYILDPVISPLWREWLNNHERMVVAYDRIRRDPRFMGTLFRPLRESRWRPPALPALLQPKANPEKSPSPPSQRGTGRRRRR